MSQTGILSAGSAGVRWGELKQATVLFADIASSTEQIAHLDPEEAMERLQPALMSMCEGVERFGGTVTRTLGDGILALFGAPRALEGHGRLACEAALHLQAIFAGHPQGLQIRVGLHSGLVASDPHARDGRQGGGVHGLTIHLASRVVGTAAPGGVALTAECHALVRASVDVRSMGYPKLRGFAEPIEIFELVGLKPAFASQNFHQSKLTPFRGRDGEMAQLRNAQEAAGAGKSQVLGISAAPGTGKSRLCFEFAQWCRARNVPVFEVAAQPYGSSIPLQPVVQLFRALFFDIAAGDDAAQARAKVQARMVGLAGVSPTDIALLTDFLGLRTSPAGLRHRDTAADHARLPVLIRELLRSQGNAPGVVLMEDIHWLDEASEDIVAKMMEASADTCLLFIVNFRSQYSAARLKSPRLRQIDLAEMTQADMNAVVRELISHSSDLNELCKLVVQRSAGNPFFAEELVRSLAEGGLLAPEDGRAATRNLHDVEHAMPATVQAVIGARVDRLGDRDKALLQTCSIIGKEIPVAILERVAATMGSAELARGIESLCHSDLLLPHSSAGERRYVFRHPMIQEVAYASQLKAKRSGIHALVAGAMEQHFQGQLDEFAALIAHHFEASGKAYDAARYAAKAARWIGVANSGQAIKLWQKSWDLLKGCERSPDTDRLRTMAGGHIGVLGWRQGLRFEDVKPVIDEAIALATGKDDRLVQLLLIVDGRMQVSSGGSADAFVTCALNALALTAANDHGRMAMLNALLSQAFGWAGRIDDALRTNDMALSMAHAIDDEDRAFVGFDISEWLTAMRSRLLLKAGRLDEASEWLIRHMAGRTEKSDPIFKTVGHVTTVEYALMVQDLSTASGHAQSLVKLAEETGIPYVHVFSALCAGIVDAMKSDWAPAQLNFLEALNIVRRASVAMEFEPEILEHLADACWRAGDAAGAVKYAVESIDVARARGARVAECKALITLGKSQVMAHGRASSLDDALAHLALAESLIRETGAASCTPALRTARALLRAHEPAN
ncbi:MAG: AAA family ATPase [Burkholderiaceae bacterium]|nr:AAA family ATPase [Burkholderiaceae bacterium]